ncbi:PPA1309 family protein [Corynebacterium uropygiale]|uniref:PPA1309 family protein n=1 Tax=Corynebacterium uropygiale TaxID=1775911 RepID=A0A9X1QML4_9CORY|nr:PPA1309 family protein [Corynebacterium uropygiale]MCF4006102.1 PPA1309 family protein [Corynebacterium uropygiale]
MMEAVEYIHAEGWDADSPTLFALVPTALMSVELPDVDEDTTPLTLVVQDPLPPTIRPGSPELADYLTRTVWPTAVEGIVLAQEIRYRDTSDPAQTEPRPARLFSGVLRDGAELTLLQLRPSEEELEEQGPFAEDRIELRGGPEVAPAVIEALRFSLEQDPSIVEDES